MKNTSKDWKHGRHLIFDESGNLGHSGRYFVISCIETYDAKGLENTMRRKIGQAKEQFPALAALHENEIKAKDAYPAIKYHIAETLVEKNVSISYIVADINHVKPYLLEDKNILYNYLMQLLITRIVGKNSTGNRLWIDYDNHSTKTGSLNSLQEYITLKLIYECDYDIRLLFSPMDSDATDAYRIQAADYVANAIYSHYEYGVDVYYDLLKPKFSCIQEFPYRTFGT